LSGATSITVAGAILLVLSKLEPAEARATASTSAVAVRATGGSGTPHPRSKRLERKKNGHARWTASSPPKRPRFGRNIG
jgi:hypothetical protein